MNQKGHYREARKLLTRVEALPPATPSDLAINQGLRAIFLEEQGNLADAELEYRKSIASWERLGRGASTEVVPELGNLASLYIKKRRITEALLLLERAFRITETVPCDANIRVGTLVMLAFAHSLHKDDAEAEKYFRRGLDLLSSLPPAVRAQTGRKLYFAYSSFLEKVGRKKEAKEFRQQAYGLFGPDPSGISVDIDSWLLNSTQH
jgi:tetratricopeptide (TPR) repeat protein